MIGETPFITFHVFDGHGTPHGSYSNEASAVAALRELAAWNTTPGPPAADDFHIAVIRTHDKRKVDTITLEQIDAREKFVSEAKDRALDEALYQNIMEAIDLSPFRSPTHKKAMRETLRRFRAGEHMDLPESQAWAEANRRKPREQAPGGEGP